MAKGKLRWKVSRFVGDQPIMEGGSLAAGTRVCITQFPDGSHGWWPFMQKGHQVSTLPMAVRAAQRYVDSLKKGDTQ